jgi:hypothetical protein
MSFPGLGAPLTTPSPLESLSLAFLLTGPLGWPLGPGGVGWPLRAPNRPFVNGQRTATK